MCGSFCRTVVDEVSCVEGQCESLYVVLNVHSKISGDMSLESMLYDDFNVVVVVSGVREIDKCWRLELVTRVIKIW